MNPNENPLSNSIPSLGNPNNSMGGYIPGPQTLYPPNPLGGLYQTNPMNVPNLNYSLPSNPMNNSMGNFPYNTNPYPGMTSFNPNDNYMNSMMNNSNMQQILMAQTANMANYMGAMDPNLELNQFLLARMNEKEEMQEKTKIIRKGLNDLEGKSKVETREERRKRMKRKLYASIKRSPVDLVVPRSEYFYSRDRYFLEQLIMKPLKTKGLLGRGIVTDFDKSNMIDDRITFKKLDVDQMNDEEEYFERAVKDGIYLDYIKQLIFAHNIQKIEQRAAREGNKNWFTNNGDIRMDNDIFHDVITKPMDISLNDNFQFNTFYGNSIFSGRNSMKLKPFKLKIIISKIIFRYHPMFSQEDVLCSQVRDLHRDYYNHMNRLNVPYLKEKIATIQNKMDEYSRSVEQTDSMKVEMKNMKIFLDESTTFLAQEKKLLNDKANDLYNKWLELKRLRENQGYQNTKLQLNVIRFNCNDLNPNIFDYAFIISDSDIETDPMKVSKDELNRRNNIKNNNVFLKVYINGIFAFQTKTSNITWPNFEVDINQLFILTMYTRPAKMEIELYINKDLIRRFEAEPPGIFAKTVTSSSTLYEVITFGKGEEVQEKKKENDGNRLDTDYNNTLINEEKEKLLNKEEEEKKKKEEEEKLKEKQNEIEGDILLKTEWEGRAPDLPEIKIEDKLELVNKQLNFKELIRKYNKFDYPFDVNDPRNVAVVDKMKKERLQLMLKFLYKEYMLNYYDVPSTRHFLLLKRLEKKSLVGFTFPILETQINKDEGVKELLKELKKEEKLGMIAEEDEYEIKIRKGLENLRQRYSGRILSDEEYLELQKEKIRVLKKDIIIQSSLGYTQIIDEYELPDEPFLIFKECIRRILSPKRKLAPLRVKPPPVKVEKTESMKINIHIVKGYNVPIRITAAPTQYIDHKKLESIGLRQNKMRDVFLADNQRINSLNAMTMPNRPNAFYGSMNNSNAFNPNALSNNQSINMDMMRSGTIGNNPNFANTMFNPANPGLLGLYNQFERKDLQAIDKVRTLAQLEKRVNSFIEVKIVYYDQEGIFRTDSVDSIHPDYNHQFEYIIKPKDGAKYFTREELSKCPGLFYFTLYDEIRRETLLKGKDANTFIQRFEKKYLGSFSIPFATVFQNASILDTICKVDIPKTVFGYYSDITATFDVSQNNEIGPNELNQTQGSQTRGLGNLLNRFADTTQQENIEVPRIVNPFINTYVSLYITLDPIPDFTKNDDLDYVPGFEDSIFLINGTKWLKNMKAKPLLKNRTLRLFAENFDGLSVFMPRFLKPDGQIPPQLIFNEQDPNAIEKAARFVALIPFIEDNQTWDYAEEMPDCWCTDNEFIALGFGDYEEHAVLLCNYFNYIDQKQNSGCKSYLILGDAHPEGSTIYVMRFKEETNEFEFWNAKTGDCFYFEKNLEYTKCFCLTVSQQYKCTKSQTNTICQLKSIGAIVTFDNIYVNIQSESDPGLIELDIKNTSKWTPFLTEESMKKYFPNGVKTVQKPLEYTESSEEAGLQLKDSIREYLKKSIETVRGELNSEDRPLRTNWEMTATAKIERILEKYDMFCFNINRSGINYTKNHQNVIEDRKQEQSQMVKSLLEYEKEIKDEFVGVNEIYGFPINLGYTTMIEIWEQIKLTSVHLIADENCELCLSVYVNPLPAGVNSVWIFFAILKKGM